MERYTTLGIEEALGRRSDYAAACKELALLLRGGHHLASKTVQHKMFEDTLRAFSMLPRMKACRQREASLLLAQAASAALPKQKKGAALREFKAHTRSNKSRPARGPGQPEALGVDDASCSAEVPSDIAQLPDDILLHVFRYLDCPSLGSVTAVSRLWRQVAADESLWEAQYTAVLGERRAGAFRRSLRQKETGVAEPWRLALCSELNAVVKNPPLTNRAKCSTCTRFLWLSPPPPPPPTSPNPPTNESTPSSNATSAPRPCVAKARAHHQHTPIHVNADKVLHTFMRPRVGSDLDTDSDSDSDSDNSAKAPHVTNRTEDKAKLAANRKLWAFSARAVTGKKGVR